MKRKMPLKNESGEFIRPILPVLCIICSGSKEKNAPERKISNIIHRNLNQKRMEKETQ